MRRNVKVALLVVLAALLVAGCATTKMSLTGKAAMVLSTYNAQAQSTAAMSHRTDLTDAQKEIVRKKKAIFLKLDPLIEGYGKLIKAGGVPSAKDEQAIYNLIDELVAFGS